MPRNVKESDEEVETKGARRTRAALNSSALDSPLRRSTRIKPPANQEHSSPESVSDATSVSAPKNTRRRTTTGETGIPEAARITRGRRNSAASDISELTETESLPDGPSKRVTRRSVAGTSLADTPTMLNGRPRRATRAGSETKSTPPVGRPIRRTRASSMEPETIDETKNRQVGTPVKSRKRASVMPSEPAVAEESEDGRSADVAKNVAKTVYETNEDESETSTHNTSTLREKSTVDGNESDEKMEVDDSSVKGTEGDTIEIIEEESTDISVVSRKLEDSMKIADTQDDSVAPDKTPELEKLSSLSKGSSHTIETSVNNPVEKQDKNPGNKENEVSNSGDVPIDRGDKLSDNEARLVHKKTLKPTLAKIAAKRRSVSSDDNFSESKIASKNQEIAGTESPRRAPETPVRKGFLVDECVVLIEPMDINQVDKVIVTQTFVVPKSKPEDDKVAELESNPPLVAQQEEAEAPEKESTKNKEDATNDEDVVDGDSDLKISNVVSMAREEKPQKKDDKPVDEAGAEAIKIKEPIETIDLESSVAEDEETCKNLSIVAAKPIDSQSSIINENPKTNEETEEIIVFEVVKGKSSIVTESPVSGTNAEEATGSVEEQSNDKSLPNGGSPVPSSEKLVEDVEAESMKKKNETEKKVAESDDDSEYSGYPAFKDIPADEWLGGNAEATKKQTSDETNSVHSASTERNESECELELVDKEALPSGEKYEYKREEKFDYDTDDTVITQVIPTTRETEDKRNEEKAAVDEVTPMDVSSDPDEDGDVASKSSRESKKRSSLATPRKSIGANTPLKNKNDSLACSMDVEPTIAESPTKDDANVSVKSNRSSSKSPKKRSSLSAGRAKNDDSSDSDEEIENSDAKTRAASTANRKSLEASAKKLGLSAKNTPSKIETEASGSPAKRRSSNKFTRIYNFDNSDDELDDVEDKNKSSSESGAKQSGIDEAETFAKTASKQGKSRLSGMKLSDGNSSRTLVEDTQSSPLIAKEQDDRSVKTGSARKSISKRNTSKITDSNSDSEIDDEDSLAKTDKSSANKNDSQDTQDCSDSEVEGDNAKEDSASPEIDEENLNEPAKKESARTSAIHEENLNGSAKKESARKSAIHEENLNVSAKQGSARKSAIHEKSLNRSSKQGSARKSAIDRNSSKIASVTSDSDAEIDDPKRSPKSSESVSRASKSSLIDTDSEADEAEAQPKVAKSKIGSAKKSLLDVDKNYSTIAQVNSDSEVIESSSSDEETSSMIPQFFFDQDSISSSSNSSIENDDSSDTIDSDVARDLNLHGRSILEYSDDDVPADDCLATESESSDSDDDGADLLDFVVEDDEEYDSFEDVAMELGAEENDSSESEMKKPRRRIISRPGGESDSDESSEEKARAAIESDIVESAAKTPRRDRKANKSDLAEPEVQSGDLGPSSKAAAKRNKNTLIQSSTPRAPIGERLSFDKAYSPNEATPLSKSLKNADSSTRVESQTASAKKLSKSVCETEETPSKLGSSFKAAKTPTPLSKSLKNADSSTRVESGQTSSAKKLSKSVCETEETPTKLGSSFKAAKTPTPLSKSLKNADSSAKLESGQTSSAKKLSKSVCETEETPTKLGSSFKVAKTPKTPGTAAQQLQTSLPADFTGSVGETKSSKTKSTKLSALNQTMTTPNTESPETRFLMKEKLNDTLPALKLQQRAKASRRSTLDNLREIPSTDEQVEDAVEESASVDSAAASVEPEVDDTEKKRRKKKSEKNTSLDLDAKSLGTSMEIDGMSIDNGSFEGPSVDASRDMSKKRDKKKKKVAEVACSEIEVPEESKNELVPTKDKKKKKRIEENIEEIQVSEANKKDKKKRKKLEGAVDEVESIEISKDKKKKKKQAETVDEVESIEISKDKKKKKKQAETVDEVESIEISKKDKKKKKREEIVDEVESIEISKKDKKKKKREETVNEVESIEISKKDKKKKKRVESVDEIVAEEPIKKDKNRKRETTLEAAEAPVTKKKSLRDAEKNGARDSSNDSDDLPEAVQDAKSKRQQRKIRTRLTPSNAVETSKTTLKRLPDEVLESLAETAERPTKRRKISKAEKIVPSRTMFDGTRQATTSIKIDDGFIPLSASGGTTEFAVVNLQKATRKSKKSVAAGSFRERMLARNSRQPISAYLMYQHKQKASGKDRPY